MTWQKFLLWFTMMAPLAYSAGPNNVLCASLSSQFGVRRILPFIAGMNTTVLIATIGVGYCFGTILGAFPVVLEYVKYLGSGFILLLTIKFFKTFNTSGREAEKSIPGFFEGILLNALNPKAIMALAVMYTQFLDHSVKITPQIIVLSVLTFLVSVSAHFLWASGGNLIGIKFQSQTAKRAQQIVFTTMLVGVAVVLLFI